MEIDIYVLKYIIHGVQKSNLIKHHKSIKRHKSYSKPIQQGLQEAS